MVQGDPFRVKAVGLASLACQVPWKPKETLAPGAIVALYDMLVAVTNETVPVALGLV